MLAPESVNIKRRVTHAAYVIAGETMQQQLLQGKEDKSLWQYSCIYTASYNFADWYQEYDLSELQLINCMEQV